MLNFLCYSSLILLLNEVYFIFNRNRLDTNFANKDIAAVRHLDLLYYFLRTFSFVWVLMVPFCAPMIFFVAIVSILALKFALYHINENVYRLFAFFLPVVYSLVYAFFFFLVKR